MNAAFELLNEAIDCCGGTVARLMGDAQRQAGLSYINIYTNRAPEWIVRSIIF